MTCCTCECVIPNICIRSALHLNGSCLAFGPHALELCQEECWAKIARVRPASLASCRQSLLMCSAACRSGDAEAAVRYARTVLSPLRGMFSMHTGSYDAMLADVVALLVYENPQVRPAYMVNQLQPDRKSCRKHQLGFISVLITGMQGSSAWGRGGSHMTFLGACAAVS